MRCKKSHYHISLLDAHIIILRWLYMKILIAAGGTGGHINPGIAIGKMLKEKGHEVNFVVTN